MNLPNLRAVHDENYAIRQAITDRGKRIDALGVDRSRFDKMPAHVWSVEAEASEGRLAGIRAATTLAERVACWRTLFALTRLVQKRTA